jgi:hypothetical protein
VVDSGTEPVPWEATWEVEFPAADREQLLLSLVVRDLVNGSSFDLELAEPDAIMAVDYLAGDEQGHDVYRLLVTARVHGPEDRESLQRLTEEVLEELIAEAERSVEACQRLDSHAMEKLSFEAVPEDEERWDLVIPDWLAPDGAEVPFGFRPVVTATASPWPSDELIDAHGRVVLVPCGGVAYLYAIPAPADQGLGGRVDLAPETRTMPHARGPGSRVRLRLVGPEQAVYTPRPRVEIHPCGGACDGPDS